MNNIIEQLLLAFQNIAIIMQYFVSGFIFLNIISYLCSKKMDKNYMLLLSCIISYVLVSFITYLCNICKRTDISSDAFNVSALTVIIAILLALLLSYFLMKKDTNKLLVKYFHKTFHDDIWHDVLDLENGSNLKVYLKNEPYYIIGHHKNHEENGNDSWLALSGFAKFNKKTNRPYKGEPSYLENNNVIITIRLSDVEHIEIFNSSQNNEQEE